MVPKIQIALLYSASNAKPFMTFQPAASMDRSAKTASIESNGNEEIIKHLEDFVKKLKMDGVYGKTGMLGRLKDALIILSPDAEIDAKVM